MTFDGLLQRSLHHSDRAAAVAPGLVTFLEHAPFSPLPTGRVAAQIHAAGAPGEMISAAFSLQAGASAVELILEASEAASQSAVIPAELIELYVVHIWDQAGIALYQGQRRAVPELLLKDENGPLKDAYQRTCSHRKHFYRRGPYYRASDVRLCGAVRASLRAGERKQFWISVKIPDKASPGIYEGYVHLSVAAGESSCDERLPLRLEILPIHLADPQQDLFLWYKGTLDCRRPQHYVSEQTMRAQLQDIHDHGFTSISLGPAAQEYLQAAIEIARSVGFNRNLLLEGPFDQRHSKLRFGELRPIYYLSDKLDLPRFASSTRHHFRNWKFARAAGATSMCSLMRRDFARRLLDEQDIGHAPDIFNYYLPSNLNYFRMHAAFPELRNHKTYYYWQCHMEKPNLHRVLAGLFLWKSKADGIAPYCYQHRPKFPNSTFNDFDEWEPGYFFGPEKRQFKDHMSTYPAAAGSIPTLQWKGLSAGLYDLRYLVTLEAALQKASSTGSESLARKAQEIRAEVERFLGRISLHTIAILDEQEAEPYPGIEPAEYAEFRQRIAQALANLQPQVEAA